MVSVALSARAADDRPEVAIRARLDFDAPEINGAAEVRWRNAGAVPARTLQVFLFANRFRSIDSLNDLARHLLIAGQAFRPGGTDLVSVREAGASLSWRFENVPSLPPHTVAAVDLGRDVLPGEEIAVTIDFRTRLPNLLDTFGDVDGLVVADGGWYPPPLAVDSTSANDLCASTVATRAELSIPAGSSLLVNGKRFAANAGIEVTAPAGERLSFVLSRTPFETSSFRVGGRTVEIDTVPARELAYRISPGQAPLEVLADTLPSILAESSEERSLRVVRLPLRWYPSASAPGMVLVSDRLFEIFPIFARSINASSPTRSFSRRKRGEPRRASLPPMRRGSPKGSPGAVPRRSIERAFAAVESQGLDSPLRRVRDRRSLRNGSADPVRPAVLPGRGIG